MRQLRSSSSVLAVSLAAAGSRDVWPAGPLVHRDGRSSMQVSGFSASRVLRDVEAVSPTDVWAGGQAGAPATLNVPLVLRYSCAAR